MAGHDAASLNARFHVPSPSAMLVRLSDFLSRGKPNTRLCRTAAQRRVREQFFRVISSPVAKWLATKLLLEDEFKIIMKTFVCIKKKIVVYVPFWSFPIDLAVT